MLKSNRNKQTSTQAFGEGILSGSMLGSLKYDRECNKVSKKYKIYYQYTRPFLKYYLISLFNRIQHFDKQLVH